MRLLFINPPNIRLRNDVNKAVLPLGLAYLAAVLLEKNHEVRILDCVIEGIENEFVAGDRDFYGLGPEQIEKEIAEYRPDVVGVSCMFTSLCDISTEICKMAKERGVAYTLVGGATPSASPQIFTASPFVDFVFIGESERSIADFVRIVEHDPQPDFGSIAGILYKDSGLPNVSKPKPFFIEDLDVLPFPARHLLPMERYFQVSSYQGGVYKSKRNTTIMTSRGCTAKCCFCASANMWGHKFRYRSADNVIMELKALKSDYGIEEFQIQDDNFTFNKNRILELCSKLEGLGLHWSMPNGVALWALDEDRIKAMSKAGCHFVIAAIESGNQRVLEEVIGKPLKLDRVLDVCRCIRRHGIALSGFFIVGFPDETLDEIRDSFDFASRCDLDIANFSYATPLPSTALWEQAEREDLFAQGFDVATITYERPSLKSKHWTIDDLQKLVLSLSRRYYLKTFLKRPRIILFRILDSLRRDPVGLLRILYYRLLGK